MSQLTEAVVTILTAVIGVAILSVLVSKQSNTTGVVSAFGSAFSSILGTAVSPVTGGSGGSFNMPTLNFGSGLNGGFPFS
jgi:hypothetical protein